MIKASARLLLWSAVALVVLAALAVLALGAALRSDAGSARVLSWVPGLQVVEPRGAVLGPFQALRMVWRGADGSQITLVEPRWAGVDLAWAPQARWRLALSVHTLQARRVDVQWVSKPSGGPLRAPTSLALPVALRVQSLAVERFQSSWTGAVPVGPVQGSLALQQAGAKPGEALHQVALARLNWQDWQVSGDARVGAQGPMTVSARVQARSARDEAQLDVSGPLTRLAVQGQVSVLGRDAVPAAQAEAASAQGLRVLGEVAPFEAWPVLAATVQARRFDLQRLVGAWPATRVSGSAQVQPRDRLQGAPGTRMQAIGAGPKGGPAVNSDLLVHIDLRNEEVGAWDAGRLPVAELKADLVLPGQASTQRLAGVGREGRVQGRVTLAPVGGREGGQIQVEGRWSLDRWQDTAIRGVLQRVEPLALHSGAPTLRLAGTVQVQGQADHAWLISGDLQGVDAGGQVSTHPVQAQWSARWLPQSLNLNRLTLTSSGAKATAQGRWLTRPDGVSEVQGDLTLQGFDPAVWLPWPSLPGRTRSETRLDGQMSVSLTRAAGASWRDVQGQGKGGVSQSMLLGVPVSGQWQWQLAKTLQAQAQVTAAANEARVTLTLPSPQMITSWSQVAGAEIAATLQAPALAALQPWARVAGVAGLTGTLSLDGRVSVGQGGQWRSDGQTHADSVSAELPDGGKVLVQGARAQWAVSTQAAEGARGAPPWKIDAELARAQWGGWGVQQGLLSLQGTPAQHHVRAQVRVDLPERKLPSGGMFKESVRAQWVADAAWHGGQGERPRDARWTAKVQTLQVLPLSVAPVAAWLDVQPFEATWQTGSTETRWQITPTRATLFGTSLMLRQAQWRAPAGNGGDVDLWVDLEPLKVSELLARWQARAGWGGDLTVTGQLKASHRDGAGWIVDAQVARREGDLSLADSSIEGGGEQRFGLRQISLDLKARDGVWTARQAIEGRVIGTFKGQQIVQAHDAGALPVASDPLQGDLSIQVSNLRPLGAWAPAGWRLAGQLAAQARLSGVLGAPQYSGTVTGQKLGASHALLGVSFSEGDLLLTLQGDQARLDRLTARGGGEGSAGGRIELTGEALLGAQPTATLTLRAERFGLLSRIDRRAVVSGEAQLALGAETLKVDGRLKVDEGLVDLSRDDAPTIGEDVNVLNRPGEPPDDESTAAPVARRKWQVQLALDLGSALRLKGRGIDTRLSGGLRLSTPGGRPQVQGTISTADGTYIAYGQKLVIERGTLAFTGPTDNPRLDIQAMRAQSPLAASNDVKVGVLISGTAQDPRVRLYSEPPMSETEKLSWLVLGRGPAGLGGADIGLLQTAASALLGGEGASPKDTVISAIGLDELSVRQTDGAVRDTIVTVGKQISNRWYIGYERSLNATTGTWQAIYRLAQRFTLRAQTGDDNAIDLIWSWRWGQ